MGVSWLKKLVQGEIHTVERRWQTAVRFEMKQIRYIFINIKLSPKRRSLWYISLYFKYFKNKIKTLEYLCSFYFSFSFRTNMQTPLALQQICQLCHCEAQLHVTINKIILIYSVFTKKTLENANMKTFNHAKWSNSIDISILSIHQNYTLNH